MLILADRVKESSLSAGSGVVTLDGPVAGYQAFSGVLSSGDQTYYTIVNNQAWEVGVGTYYSSGLSRDTILSSSTGSKINLSGQSYVFIAYPAEKSVYRNLNDQIVVTSSGIRFSDGSIQTTASSGGGGGGGTYYAGTGLILSGSTFHIDPSVITSGSNISLLINDAGFLTAHPTITAATSLNNSGRTYIQDVYLDSNGHVTGLSVATETVTDTTYTAGTGLQLSGTVFSIDSSVIRSGSDISLLNNNAGYLTSHPIILSASGSNNSGRTYIQDILLDSNGHVTGISTATETIVDTDTTYTAGTGLVLNGTQFNIDGTVIQSGDSVSLLSNDAGYLTSHPSVLAASNSNNSGRTYIQDILLDSNGHVTGISTATETVVDTDTTYTAGTGLQLSGTTFSVDSTVIRSGSNISLLNNNVGYLTSHPTISAASSSNNSGRTYIQDILVDSNGHITGIVTATETVVDTNTTYTAGSGLNLSGTVFSTSGSGVFTSIYLPPSTPSVTSNTIYNSGGTLYFNGSGIGGGGGSTYSAGSGLVLSGTTFHTTGSLPIISNWTWSSGQEVPSISEGQFSVVRVGSRSGNLLALDSSGWIDKSAYRPASDAYPTRSLVPSAIAIDVASPTQKDIGGTIAINSTGIYSVKWFYNCKSTSPLTTTARVIASTGMIDGATGDTVGISYGNGTPAVLTLAFTSSSGLLTGAGRAGTTANLTSELVLKIVSTGFLIPELTTNNAGNGGTVLSGYLEAKKID